MKNDDDEEEKDGWMDFLDTSLHIFNGKPQPHGDFY